MLDEVVLIKEQYYILATSALADNRSQVLKYGETFAVLDRFGDIQPMGLGEQGIFHQGTRFLSRLLLRLGTGRPHLLSSKIREDNSLFTADLCNVDMQLSGHTLLPRGSVHVTRSKFLWRATCYERFTFSNYSASDIELPLSLEIEADFADIFEVRGMKRAKRGERLPTVVDEDAVTLAYRGLDNTVRKTMIVCSLKPFDLTASRARFELTLRPKETVNLDVTIQCAESATVPTLAVSYEHGFAEACREPNLITSEATRVSTSNEEFDNWIRRSASDLQMMIAGNPEKWYPYAGVPWFSTVFGRDGLITAFECLWLYPDIAKGVLKYLAETQATEVDSRSDAEPGKILHETRRGEMAALGEIPFARYYGSVDATPLFVMLAGAYYERTADLIFIRSIWPGIQLALQWIESYGDADGDGFVEYSRTSENGLVQQGWKDSNDSIFHADGTLAQGPIALCEVQGYVYAAWLRAAELSGVLGEDQQAESFRLRAETLKRDFERAFWCDDISTYALALDGRKEPCRVGTSNAGHCLFAGIAEEGRAHRVAQRLVGPDFFSGWGIRTVSTGEYRYNPMSYHNGSVWPHDNAMIACGLANYGFKEAVLQILKGLFDASIFLELHRLPELFCGFDRRAGEGPTLYPVACAPQAWSAAAVFGVLQASLGISVQAADAQICFSRPRLPAALKALQIDNLRIGDASVDLAIEQHERGTGVRVLRTEGDVAVTVRYADRRGRGFLV